jgi:hypothetical protein
MKALEFLTPINPDSTLTVPSEIAAQLPQGLAVRVLLLLPEDNENQEWAKLTAEQFLQGYAASDRLYDSLAAG